MGGPQSQLPDPSCARGASPSRCATLCSQVLCWRDTAELARWGEGMATVPGLDRAAQCSPMLRVLLKIATMLGAPALLDPLRALYAEPIDDEMLQAERDAAMAHDCGELLRSADAWLGIARRRRRRRPFKTNESHAPGQAVDAAVTVLPVAADALRESDLAMRLAEIETRYVTFTSQDARFHPRRMEICIAALEKQGTPAMLFTGVFHVDEFGKQVSAAASNRLDLGCASFDWIAAHEGLRNRARSKHRLLETLLAGDLTLSISNLIVHRELLSALCAQPGDANQPLHIHLALHAAIQSKLIYLPRKLLSLTLPSLTDLPAPQVDDARSVETRDLASTLCDRDRSSRDLDLMTRNRDRLEGALSSALGDRAQSVRIAITLPPDQESWRRFRKLCGRLSCRPHLLHWQDVSARFTFGTLLRSDDEAQRRDLAYLHRHHGNRLKHIFALVGEALEIDSVKVEALPEIRLAAIFAKKVKALSPDYLHSWGLNQGSIATMLAQLLFDIPRGLVLQQHERPRGIGHKLMTMQLASADYLVVPSERWARGLAARGIPAERILPQNGARATLTEVLGNLGARTHQDLRSR